MIFSGDEFGNSQGGNNNPYCQDNETGWVDWKALDKNGDIQINQKKDEKNKLYLYDIVQIKKETSTPLE